jgi:hypothetical protein
LAPIGFEIPIVIRLDDLHGLVRGQAFRRLLAASVPATGQDLAACIGISADKVAQVLDELNAAGRIRRDEAGRVIGSAGLSVVADRHQIDFEGRRFWTWCAYDILGIFAPSARPAPRLLKALQPPRRSRSAFTTDVPRRPVSCFSDRQIRSPHPARAFTRSGARTATSLKTLRRHALGPRVADLRVASSALKRLLIWRPRSGHL